MLAIGESGRRANGRARAARRRKQRSRSCRFIVAGRKSQAVGRNSLRRGTSALLYRPAFKRIRTKNRVPSGRTENRTLYFVLCSLFFVRDLVLEQHCPSFAAKLAQA